MKFSPYEGPNEVFYHGFPGFFSPRFSAFSFVLLSPPNRGENLSPYFTFVAGIPILIFL